jgi:hypothetical protein
VDGRLERIVAELTARGFHALVEDDESASRAVPQRIAVVHGSRRPLAERRPLEPPHLRTEEDLASGADVIFDEVAARLEAADATCGEVRVALAQAPHRAAHAAFLEQLTASLAELLGVAGLEVAHGWATGGIVRSDERS